MTVSDGTLSPSFSAIVLNYTVTVPYTTSSITVSATTATTGVLTDLSFASRYTAAGAFTTVGTNAYDANSFAFPLNPGNNNFLRVISSDDFGNIVTTNIRVTRTLASTNNDLSALTLSTGAFSPSFASGTTSYSATVGFLTTSATVTPTVADAFSTIRVRVNGGAYSTVASASTSSSLSLNVGANPIDVEVTAQDLSTKVYTITVTRDPASTISTLSAMSFSAGVLSPSFSSGTTAYSFSVANAVTSTTVTSTVTYAAATIQVKVNGGSYTTVASGVASGALALNVGANTVDVRVTAEDGVTISTYTTTITRAASIISTLSALSLSTGTLAPSFATGTLSYTASVANAVSSITVTPTVTDITATIQVRVNGGAYSAVASASASGSLSLNVGANTIDVLVTAQDGLTTSTYTITVTRASVSTDASLSNIVVSSAFGSAFASGTFSYTVNVPFSVSTFSYTATVNQVAATIQSRTNANPYATIASGAIQTLTGLPVGTTGIDIQVTAEDAVTVLTYHIDFIRAPASTVSSLSALSMSTGVLAPVFASGTFAYTSSVVFATSSLTVTPTATSSVSTIRVRVNGGAYSVVTSATASASLALNLGANTIDVQVTAEDGVTISTYTITVTRLSAVSTLSSMVFNAGTLAPVFASGTITYTSSVSFSTTTITVTPTVTLASNATIRVRVNGGAYVALASGVTSALALNVGVNTVDVEVTSEDGSSITVYTNTITRVAVSTNADLSALVLSAGTLSPVFSSGTVTYSAGSVNQASITFTPTVAQLNATMTYSLNGGASVVITSGATSAALALNMGANTLVVTVTAEDGTTIKTYTVNITRISVSSNAYLSNLVSSTGALNTAFNKFDIDYETYVLIATSSLTVTPTAEDPTATIQVRINNTGFSPEPYVTVVSGAASPVMTLQEGDNMIDVTVTAQDGVTIINYRIKVSREASWVSGGGGGGLESRSLGDAVAKRIFNKALNSENGPVDYGKLPQVQFRDVQNRVQGAEPSKVSLTSIMPDITSKGYVAYNSSPKDLTSITNAKEVLAFDFTANKEVKAVAFATKTLGELYDHTKPICDRLKGATLLGVETVKVQGLEFIKYSIKNENGQKEYATSFSVGTKAGRPDFSLQSIYLTQDYANDETMYNFQLWAGSTSLVTDMVADILTKLKAIAPVNVIKSSVLPSTYVESGKREGQNINLVVKNATPNTSGYFKLEDKATETSASTVVRNIPFTINANGKSNVIIPMDDKYESTLTMYVGGEVKDVVYMSDGTWAVDYNKATTVLSSFNVINDSKRAYSADEYPLFRNVELKANSSDYVSVVKLLRGGGATADLNAFKGLKFSASGGYNLHVTLVKNGIVDYRNQYAADVQLELGQQDYYIGLDNFKSASTNAKIDAKDITSIIFTVEVGTGRNSPITTTIANVAFTKEDLNYLNSLDAKAVSVYPNPVTGNRITVNFSSAKAAELSLRVTDMNGKVLTLRQVQAVKGMNTVQVPVGNGLTGVHLISLDGADIKYKTTKVMIAN